jgi:hypothetical protein
MESATVYEPPTPLLADQAVLFIDAVIDPLLLLLLLLFSQLPTAIEKAARIMIRGKKRLTISLIAELWF